nr:unnamed protein product [Callosobruchus chinensis]
MMKGTAMFINRDKVLDLLTRINTKFWNYEDDSDSRKRKCLQPLYDVKKIINIYVTMYSTTLTCFALVPVFSKGEVLIYECYRPSWIPYRVLLFLEQLTGVLCTLFTILPVDFLFMSVTTLTRVQYKLLNEELRHIFDSVTDSKDRVVELRRKIRACAEHHAFLNDFIRRINETFSVTLLVFHLIVLVSMCMEMYRASSVSEWKVLLKPMAYTLMGLFAFTICYCAYSQTLIDEASNVSLSAYFSDWTKSCTAASPLIMIISSAQKEVSITAGGITNIDLKCSLDVSLFT